MGWGMIGLARGVALMEVMGVRYAMLSSSEEQVLLACLSHGSREM